jgi:hypothetical protein
MALTVVHQPIDGMSTIVSSEYLFFIFLCALCLHCLRQYRRYMCERRSRGAIPRDLSCSALLQDRGEIFSFPVCPGWEVAMKQNGLFDILLLIARPSAGRSEIIDYLKRQPL